MTPGRVALLLGLFAAPLVLLYLGHRLRGRGPRARRSFWGGIAGYLVGMIVSVAAMMMPPVWWTDGGAARDFVVHWAMLVGFLLGIVLGPFVGALRASPPTRARIP